MTVLSFLVVSCKKKVTITGRVYNPVTNEGISGVKVTLSKQKTGVPGSVDGSGAKIIASGLTDANGNYSFIEKLNKNKGYGIGFSYDGNLYYQIEGEYKSINAGEDNLIINWPLIPKGYVKGKIDNVNCFDSNDELKILRSYAHIPNLYGFENSIYSGCFHYEFTGSIDGSPQGYAYCPMGWHYATGTVTKNGITTPFKDSIYITAGGYHTWHLEY